MSDFTVYSHLLGMLGGWGVAQRQARHPSRSGVKLILYPLCLGIKKNLREISLFFPFDVFSHTDSEIHC